MIGQGGFPELPANMVRSIPVRRYFSCLGETRASVEDSTDEVAMEFLLKVCLNGEEAGQICCSPGGLDYLAVGYLFSSGRLCNARTVREISWDPDSCCIYVATEPSSPKAEMTATQLPTSPASFVARDICAAMRDLLGRSSAFRRTGAFHAAGLYSEGKLVLYHEDLGRHNAVDKVLGHILLEGIPVWDKLLVLTGRISAEIASKVIRANIPLVASKAPPTDVAVAVSDKGGLTVVGFVRGTRLTVYSHPWRVLPHKTPPAITRED